MTDFRTKYLTVLLLLFCFLDPIAVVGQSKNPNKKQSNEKNSYGKSVQQARKFAANYRTYQKLKKQYDDPAFARYVDLKMLGKAWDRLDSELLTDVALQLAYAEDVLQREHKAINAKTANNLALKLAMETNDQASLERLANAAMHYGNTELAAQIENADKLAGNARSLDPALLVYAASMSPMAYAKFQSVLKTISKIKLVGDEGLLGRLETSGAIDGLPEQQREYAQQQLNNLRETLTSKTPKSTETTEQSDPDKNQTPEKNVTQTEENSLANILNTLSSANRAYEAAESLKRRQ